MTINAPKGTEDLSPEKSYRWQYIEKAMLDTATLFGLKEIRTPTFESLDLFCRSVGDTTDVVQKEMYEVKAQLSSSTFALKPEGTAGVVRSVIQNGLLNNALPLKTFYITPCFRHENTQAGRLREFHQFGCEVFGPSSPNADVEIIAVASRFFDILGIKGLSLNINSIGCPKCRADYYEKLKEFFNSQKQDLCKTCLERLEKNPMRILDCKSDICQTIAKDAPVIIDYLCDDCNTHFEGVKKRLKAVHIPFSINTRIVRGLDYYTKTVFEFISNDIGAQSTVCGGGRYDGLVEQLGGKPTPALGFGMGIERLLMVMQAQKLDIPKPFDCELYIGSIGEEASIKACELANDMREEGFFVECDLMDRSIKAQMKFANKINAQFTLILGDNELETKKATVKNMQTGETNEILFEEDLSMFLYDAMLAREADFINKQIGADAFNKIMGIGN